MTELEAKNKRVCEWLGTQAEEHWWCDKCQTEKSPYQVTYQEHCTVCGEPVRWVEIPDFSADPLALLRLLEEKKLLTEIGIAYYPPEHGFIEPDALLIPLRYLTQDGALLKAVDEWIRRGK